MTNYAEMEALNAKAGTLSEALSILYWDQQSMMPTGGGPSRSDQTALLETMVHDITAGRELGEAIKAAEGDNALTPWQRANVEETKRSYIRATAIPSDLVAAKSKAESRALAIWQDARPNNDFAAALPALRDCFNLAKQAGQASRTSHR